MGFDIGSLWSKNALVPAAIRSRGLGPFEPAKHEEIQGVQLLISLPALRCFQDHWDGAKARVVDDVAKRLEPEKTAADPSVAIDTAPEFTKAVVKVPDADAFEPDDGIKSSHCFIVLCHRTERIARGKNVASIDANSKSLRFRHSIQQPGEMLEPMSKATSLPGGRLEVNGHGASTRPAVNFIERQGDPI